jgi:hypothetical protein
MFNKKQWFKPSQQTQYQGCSYHSLLELKFIIIIDDKCSWMREPIAIYYNIDTLEVTNYLNERTTKYVPDFLVRKWSGHSAHLIEVKPQKYLFSKQMKIRKTVVANYLNTRNYDWKYTILTENDIRLNAEQTSLFNKIKEENTNFNSKLHLIKQDRRYNNAPHSYFSNIPNCNSKDMSPDDYRRYVKYGIMPNPFEDIQN